MNVGYLTIPASFLPTFTCAQAFLFKEGFFSVYQLPASAVRGALADSIAIHICEPPWPTRVLEARVCDDLLLS